MSKKMLTGIITVLVLTSVLSISAFASNADGLKAAKATLKDSNTLRQQSVEKLQIKAEEKRTELGIVKLTEEQKTQLKALRDQLVPLKEQATALKTQLAAAIKDKDKAAIKSIRANIVEVRTKVTAIFSQIVAITGGKKENVADIKAFQAILKGAHDQKAPIIEAAKQNAAEIKALIAQLKDARLNKSENTDEIIGSLITKLNELGSNFEQRTTINNATANAID